MVEAQQAAVEQAQLNREFTSITSPIDGVAGLAKAQVGDLVGPSTGALTTVATVDPIKAYFTVSDQRYTAYSQRWADPAKRAEHEKQLEFELILSDGSHFPHKGELFAAETRTHVAGAQALLNDCADLFQGFAADQMTKGVIHILEII